MIFLFKEIVDMLLSSWCFSDKVFLLGTSYFLFGVALISCFFFERLSKAPKLKLP